MELVRATCEAFVEGLERGDFEGAAEIGAIAVDFEFSPAPELAQGRYRGLEGFVEFMRSWTEDFENWSVRLERLVDAPPDKVVASMHQSGVGKGSGAPVELHYGAVFQVERDRIARLNLYLDPAQAFEAAELSE